MSGNFTSHYFNFINCNHYASFLTLINTIYAFTFSNKIYSKFALYQDIQIVAKYACMNSQLRIHAIQPFALCLANRQQMLKAHNR